MFEDNDENVDEETFVFVSFVMRCDGCVMTAFEENEKKEWGWRCGSALRLYVDDGDFI